MNNEIDIQDNEKELEEKRKAAHREAQKRYREKTKGAANMKWNKQNLKRIPLDVSLEMFENIDKHIIKTNESRNGFIKRAINEAIERDNK